MISDYAQEVQNRLGRPIQTIYNLNWKHRPKTKQDGKRYSSGNNSIDFWPDAMDFMSHGTVMQVKWELSGDQVVNITFPYPEKLDELESFLYQYVWG